MAESRFSVVASKHAQPDDSLVSAVGNHHSLETAIADLVDNSLDAAADHVLIRFLEDHGVVTGLQVVDNGHGMNHDQIDSAMVFAQKREYAAGDLGHFGIGLKAASLSQADTLMVLSRAYGAFPVGRQLHAEDPTNVEELSSDEVADYLDVLELSDKFETGTVVEWSEPRNFLTSPNQADRQRWLNDRIEMLRAHLGLVFHRKIEKGKAEIRMDVLDRGVGMAGVPRTVDPIDPFAYHRVAGTRYPQPLSIELDGMHHDGTVHLWPAGQASRTEFRLFGQPGALHQGFYFYRNDRLLQVGGWNNLTVEGADLEYARVEIELTPSLSRHITINPEKSGLELDSDLQHALQIATVGVGPGNFRDFLAEAGRIRSASHAYVKRPVEIVEPGRGFDNDMLEAFEASVEFKDVDPVHVRWKTLYSEEPFHADLPARTIWLNGRYRPIIAGRDSDDADDVPLIKTLLILLFSKYFEGERLGSREKQELAAWQELLSAALRDEIAQQARRQAGQ